MEVNCNFMVLSLSYAQKFHFSIIFHKYFSCQPFYNKLNVIIVSKKISFPRNLSIPDQIGRWSWKELGA